MISAEKQTYNHILFDLEGKLIDSGPEDDAKVKIFWQARVAFVREQNNPDCGDTTRARSLSISDVGVITTVAGDWEEDR